jgi:hypothetical protein
VNLVIIKRRVFFVAIVLGCSLFLFSSTGFSQGLKFRQSQTRHFTIHFGEALTTAELRQLKDGLEDAHKDITKKMEEIIGTSVGGGGAIDVVIFKTTGDFTFHTGLPWWSASAFIDGSIYLQPMRLLKSRGILTEIIRHEVTLIFVSRLSGKNNPPVWLAEGLAVYFSGEIDRLKFQLKGERPNILKREDIDALLLNRDDIDKNRWGYVIAFEAVLEMINDGRGKEIYQLLLDSVD